MTTDRSRRRPYPPVAPAVVLAVLATLLFAGWSAHLSPGNSVPAVSTAAAGHGHSGVSLWLPRAQQPDRAGWNELPAAALAAGFVLTAGVVGFARGQRPHVARRSAIFPSSPRAPPARVSTS